MPQYIFLQSVGKFLSLVRNRQEIWKVLIQTNYHRDSQIF
jgi:hypothetical protein